jgi:hypothetical protein
LTQTAEHVRELEDTLADLEGKLKLAKAEVKVVVSFYDNDSAFTLCFSLAPPVVFVRPKPVLVQRHRMFPPSLPIVPNLP